MRTLGFFFVFCLCVQGWAQTPCQELYADDPFPRDIVNQVLERFRVPAEEWEGINRALVRQKPLIKVQIQQKAATLKRNPFNPPEQKVVIGAITREAMIESFGFVLRQHGVKETRQIYEMFDAIEDVKASRIWNCLRGS